MVISANKSSGKFRVFMPLFFILLVLAAAVAVRSVLAGCCANPALHVQGGYDTVDICSADPLITEASCCPANNDAYYNSSAEWYPNNRADCLANYWHASSCAGLSKCAEGCCYDESGSGKYSNICYGKIQSLCMLQSPEANKWSAGFSEAEQYESNPCYDLSFSKKLVQCPTISICTQYNTEEDCVSAPEDCFYCPAIGPTGGAGFCFDECDGNCLGEPADYFISNATTGLCEQPAGLALECGQQRCGAAEPSCLCAAPAVVTNSTHPYCCNVKSKVFAHQTTCQAQCLPNCIVNASLESSRNAYFPPYTKCYCGTGKLRLDPPYPGYCCGYTSGTIYNGSPCFDTGNLTGFVRDRGGTGIEGATVSIAGLSTITGPTGYYEFPELFVGTYSGIANHGDYGPDEEPITIRKGETATHNFELTAVSGECKSGDTKPDVELLFTTGCVRGEPTVSLNWVNPCPAGAIEGFYLWRDGNKTGLPFSPATTSYVDKNLKWNTVYNYTLGVKYSFLFGIPKVNTMANYSATGATGDAKCAGVTTEWACLNESGGTDGKKTLLAHCGGCNMFSSSSCAVWSGYPDSVCVGPNHNGEAICLHEADCGALGNPFGLFATAAVCRGQPETPNACYFDYSSTVVDACYSCPDTSSCFDYRSENACAGDSCLVSKGTACRYEYFDEVGEELGKGICFQDGYNGTEYCRLCDDPLLTCTQSTCQDLGDCYLDNGRCLACAPTTRCSDFTIEETCSGGQNFEIDPDCPGSAIPSNNACGLMYCVWTGTACIRDVDGDGEPDPGAIDAPPVTRVLNPPTGPVGKEGHLLELSISPGTKMTYYCVDKDNACCPRNEIPPIDPVARLPPEGVSGTGEYFFRYYSRGLWGNIELIKSMSFWLDVEGPMITINYTLRDSAKAGRSDASFDITLNKPAACTDELFPQSSANPTAVGGGFAEHFTASYPGLPDTTYLYTVRCTDLAGNTASETIEVPVNRVDLIYDEMPVGITTAETSKVLHVKTKETSACTVALLDQSGSLGTVEPMVASSENTVHEKTKTSTESKRYGYFVECVGQSLTDTTTLYFTADHLAPVTAVMFNSSNRGLQPLESGGWYRYVNIVLQCKDPELGPPPEFGCQATIHCVTRNSSCTPNKAGTSYIDPGVAHGDNYTICYTSTDGHNEGGVKCTRYNIDKEPPTTPKLNDSSLILGEPQVYYEGNKLMVSILAEDAESGVASYSLALIDEDGRPVVAWIEFEVEQDKAGEWLTAWLTSEDDEWLEDEEGHKLWLTVDETYYFKGYALDNVGLFSKEGTSDGVTMVPLNYTPEHCKNKVKDYNERGTDCGGGCPPCGRDAECGNSKVEAGEECDGTEWGAIKDCKSLGFLGGSLTCMDCQFDTLLCIPEKGSYCGDGKINRGELCDDSNWGSIKQCSIFDLFSGGLLSCDTTCSYDTIGCIGSSGSSCGDGVIDAGEQCEGTTWGVVAGCKDFGDFTKGTLFCDADCTFDTTVCAGGSGSSCGDGVIDSGEQCDGKALGKINGCAGFGSFTGGDLSCGLDCMFDTAMCTGGSGSSCGDGVIDSGEQCDGETYGAISTCSDFSFETPDFPLVEPDLPCDNCLLNTSAPQCISDREGTCGDGVIDQGEQCDGLNWAGIYGCTDFGFTAGQLVCRPDCMFDTSRCTSASGGNCGDGVIDPGEQCDGPVWGKIKDCTGLGDFTGGILACGGDCRFNTRACFGGSGSYCGDGVIDSGEQCDGSEWSDIKGCKDLGEFTGGTLACSNDCRFDTTLCTPFIGGECGDGVIDSGEQCDGSVWGDITGCKDFGFTGGKLSCLGTCRFNTRECTGGPGGKCGDSVIDAGEVCDSSTFGPVKKCLDLGFLGGSLDCTGKCHFDTTACETPWQTCIDNIDCDSLYCNPNGFCSIQTCFDGWKNGKETDVDCGGTCKSCKDEGSCSNGVKDAGEKGVDCGGTCTAGCPPGTLCTSDEDCTSRNCVEGACAVASCSDGILNGEESDIDCGRVCTPELCAIGKECKSDKDCSSGSCHLGKCVKSGEGRIDEEELPEPPKGSSLLKIVFFILLLVLLGAGGYFGYTKYMEAKHPASQMRPGVTPGLAPGQPFAPKKRELSRREQGLLSRRRMEEKRRERGKMFEAFTGGGEKADEEKSPLKKPAVPEVKQKKEDAEEMFSAFDSGATGVEKPKMAKKKPKKAASNGKSSKK